MVNKINNVLENNNNQILINKAYIDQINKLTNITNDVLSEIKKDKSFVNELVLSLLYKTKLIKEEITNAIYAIELSRMNIVSSNILSKPEINLIMNRLNKDKLNIPFNNIEEALEFTDIKVAMNSSTVIYILNVPRTEDVLYENLIVKPLIKNKNLISKIENQNILRTNNKVYGIVKDCKANQKLSICKQSNIVDLSNNKCLFNLLQGRNATCKQTNSQHVPHIEELASGTILLNNFSGRIRIDNTTQELNGTYLVKFSNTTIKIMDQLYVAEEVPEILEMPPLLHLVSKENEMKKSFPYNL